jgi:hypothetical protein
LLSAYAHLRDPVDAGQTIDDVALGIIAELQRVHVAGTHIEPDDRIGIAFHFRDFRLLGFLGQSVDDAADRVAHIVGGRFYIARKIELDADA